MFTQSLLMASACYMHCDSCLGGSNLEYILPPLLNNHLSTAIMCNKRMPFNMKWYMQIGTSVHRESLQASPVLSFPRVLDVHRSGFVQHNRRDFACEHSRGVFSCHHPGRQYLSAAGGCWPIVCSGHGLDGRGYTFSVLVRDVGDCRPAVVLPI